LPVPLLEDPKIAARAAGLRYVTTDRSGIERRRIGRGFSYVAPRGRRVRDRSVLNRIRTLAVPPAWKDVWICPDPRGHIQAIGWDARGRKQYRYHERFRAARDAGKFLHIVDFAARLPVVRARIRSDLRKSGLSRERVLAGLVYVLDRVNPRVGNDEYARTNHHFGLTTLRKDHVRVVGKRVQFSYLGKGGAERELELDDARLARLVRECLELPGKRLFQIVNGGGKTRIIRSADVNAYLCEISDCHISAKDFRTWTATVTTAISLERFGACDSPTARKRALNEAIDAAAAMLGNTRAVCRRSYVHPFVTDAYVSGTLGRELGACRREERGRRTRGLSIDEATVARFLRRHKRGRVAIPRAAQTL
jgi:DNA topoisomerase-1